MSVPNSINGRRPLLHKLAFELRYRHSHLFRDRAGRIAARFQQLSPEWMTRSSKLDEISFFHMNLGHVCTLGAEKLIIVLEQERGQSALSPSVVNDIAETARVLFEMISAELQMDVKDYIRMGFRTWFLFPSGSEKDAAQWIGTLRVFSVDQEFLGRWDGLKSSGVTLVVKDNECSHRIALAPIKRTVYLDIGSEVLAIKAHDLHKNQREHFAKVSQVKRQREHNPENAALIDIDSFVEDPVAPVPDRFIKTNFAKALSRIQSKESSK